MANDHRVADCRKKVQDVCIQHYMCGQMCRNAVVLKWTMSTCCEAKKRWIPKNADHLVLVPKFCVSIRSRNHFYLLPTRLCLRWSSRFPHLVSSLSGFSAKDDVVVMMVFFARPFCIVFCQQNWMCGELHDVPPSQTFIRSQSISGLTFERFLFRFPSRFHFAFKFVVLSASFPFFSSSSSSSSIQRHLANDPVGGGQQTFSFKISWTNFGFTLFFSFLLLSFSAALSPLLTHTPNLFRLPVSTSMSVGEKKKNWCTLPWQPWLRKA